MRALLPLPRRAFSLIEMLTAIAVLMLITLILVGISNQSGKLWLKGQSDIDGRQRARAALDVLGRELRQAALSRVASANSLQFVINPPSVTGFANRDTVFWQAPLSTDGSGGVAEVGYFVRWSGQKAALCRYFVNPSDSNYLIYTSPQNWVTSASLDAVAPATKASHYQGLFLDNIIGLWVTPYQANGTAYATAAYNSTNSYGSQAANSLPAAVEISLVMLDSPTAKRLEAMGSLAGITNLYQTTTNATSFVDGLPANIRSGAKVSSLKIRLDNYRP